MTTVEANSKNVFGRHVCDTCGKEATSAGRDRVEEPSDSEYRKFAYGPWCFGCDQHPVRRTTKYRDGRVE